MNICSTVYTLGLLAGVMLSSCVSPVQEIRSMGWVGSAAEIEALASFVVDGKTTRQEVWNKLGDPTSSTDYGNGRSGLYYKWETQTWIRPENKGEEMGNIFNPFDDGTVKSRTVDHAWLRINFGPDGVVVGHYIGGPAK
jgi:outer membrane protein assembly factor BamE (lipoprotein component of BamABCDE complex)